MSSGNLVLSCEMVDTQMLASTLRRPATTLGTICVCLVLGMLIAGLLPFHQPRNNVTWITNKTGLNFGYHGTVLSSGAFNLSDGETRQPCSLEMRLKVATGDGGTIVAFYSSDNLEKFSVRQDGTDLVLDSERRDAQRRTIFSGFSIDNVFRPETPALFTISSGSRGTEVYLDGLLIKTVPWFRISSADLDGQLVVGTSPVKNDDWSGQLQGLAIYGHELTAADVLAHYQTRVTNGLPYASENERIAVLYLFDEHSGKVVHNHGSSKVELNIPDKYTILHEKFLEPAWKEFNLRANYWKSALINVVGFVPFGFFCCAYLSLTKPAGRAAVVTVAFGFAVSLTIEVLQAYLPTRDSGTTDLITNTLGTGLGVMLYCWKRTTLTAILDRILYRANCMI